MATDSELSELEQLRQRIKVLEEQRQEWQRLKACTGNHGARWQYHDGREWYFFPPEANDEMNEAYLYYLDDGSDHTRFATVYSAGVPRKMDFQLMLQKRCDTNRTRQIRILPGVPPGWVTPPECLMRQSNQIECMYVDVSSDAGLLSRVEDLLKLTGHGQDSSRPCRCMEKARVLSVHRIEHWRLWQAYKARRESLRKELAVNRIAVTPAELDLDAFDVGYGYGQVMTSLQGPLTARSHWPRMWTRRSCCMARVGTLRIRSCLTASTLGLAIEGCTATGSTSHLRPANRINTRASYISLRMLPVLAKVKGP